MKKQTNLLFLSIVMLSMQVLFAQGMTVSGTVTDAQTGESLVGTHRKVTTIKTVCAAV